MKVVVAVCGMGCPRDAPLCCVAVRKFDFRFAAQFSYNLGPELVAAIRSGLVALSPKP